MAESARNILVFGATGPQGEHVVKAFVSRNTNQTQQYHILAVTRNPSSEKAIQLSNLSSNVQLVQDTENLEDLFQHGDVFGVFLVQSAFAADEVGQGIKIIDLAVKYGVRHLIYSGVDFAGVNPTPLPHFETKRHIESHLTSLPTPTPKMRYTILRPTTFMDNFLRPGFQLAVQAEFDPSQKYKFISALDVGKIAVEVFDRSEEFGGRVLELAGDDLTVRESLGLFNDIMEERLEVLKPSDIPDALLPTLTFSSEHPYVANVDECRKIFPFILDFKSWLAEVKKAQ